jgi:hypothetical protein
MEAFGRDGVPTGIIRPQTGARARYGPVTQIASSLKTTTMNQQGQPSSGNNAAFLPPPRQEMEYLCAGEKHAGTSLLLYF